MTRNRPLDPAWMRGMTMPRINRRDALRGAGLLGASAFLAACGVEGTSSDAPQASGFWADKTKAGQLDFANWPYYMDTAKVGGKTVHPSLLAFTKETGIKVNYKEVINENDAFLGKINPSLQAGQDPGWDLIVITDGGSIEKLIRQNFLTELDHTKLPNFAKNAAASVKNPGYDPGNKYTLAWQSGLVGLAYNPKLTKREITSYEDLYDPAFKGKITVFGDDTDFPTMVMISLGIDPAKSTEEDWKRTAEEMKKLKPQLREFVDNAGMAEGLSSGNAWISQAYSGDIYQLNIGGSPDIKFVVPKEGATYWTDNMAIPKNAKHPLDAITYMDYVYRPDVAADLIEAIAYITPVPVAKEQLQARAAKASGEDRETLEYLVQSPLIFPTQEDLTNVKRYRALTVEEEQVWDGIFQPLVQS
ncbi:MAG TPA: spermidine/putrescine ABC transporter substrate-binding protein [Actinomycetes bacterium]|nr:spermidine/putrescine ABC transporter substrate-binding protein [Actinomycetes bacterium]